MSLFFFYNKLTNIELIKKISKNFEIIDGYVLVDKYDESNNIIQINNTKNNDVILNGKIVNFLNMKIENIIIKINELEELKDYNRIKYTMETIWATKINGGVCKTYIIY